MMKAKARYNLKDYDPTIDEDPSIEEHVTDKAEADMIAEESDKEPEDEEYMEPASKKNTLPQKPNIEEIRELLPEFNGWEIGI